MFMMMMMMMMIYQSRLINILRSKRTKKNCAQNWLNYKIMPNNSNAPVYCYAHKGIVQMWAK